MPKSATTPLKIIPYSMKMIPLKAKTPRLDTIRLMIRLVILVAIDVVVVFIVIIIIKLFTSILSRPGRNYSVTIMTSIDRPGKT